MPSVDITVIRNDVPALYEAALQLLGPSNVHAEMAKEAKILTRQHLAQVNSERDGGSWFYEGFIQTTQSEADENSARVVISPAKNKASSSKRGNPLAAHYFGATIVPSGTTSAVTGKPIKHLAIPAAPEARGHSPGEFQGLKPLFRKKGGTLEAFALALPTNVQNANPHAIKRQQRSLARKQQITRVFGSKALILYWLVIKAILKPDPTVLPSPEEYEAAGVKAIVSLLDRVARRQP